MCSYLYKQLASYTMKSNLKQVGINLKKRNTFGVAYKNSTGLSSGVARPGPTRACAIPSTLQALPSPTQQQSCDFMQNNPTKFKGSKYTLLVYGANVTTLSQQIITTYKQQLAKNIDNMGTKFIRIRQLTRYVPYGRKTWR